MSMQVKRAESETAWSAWSKNETNFRQSVPEEELLRNNLRINCVSLFRTSQRTNAVSILRIGHLIMLRN